MTKGLPIEPGDVLSRGALHMSDIPVNAYEKTLQEERSRYTTEEFVDIWQDMCAIREFETILNEIKTKGAYKGVAYNHAGPAHLSIGQEAAAVGMAFSLTPDDHIFGSHRSHGEILAKGFSAIRGLSDEQLLKIMRPTATAPFSPGGGGLRRHRARPGPALLRLRRLQPRSSRGRRASTAGLGGSMHAFFAPFGIYPNNAIVGGSGSIAPRRGAVQARQPQARHRGRQHRRRSFGCGPVWEGITFSAMDQYRKLWDEALGGGLPIIFNCMNNFYGMGGQPSARRWAAVHRAHRRGRQPRADACRARERIRPAAGDRRLPPQEADAGGPRAGAARHRDLPLQRPLAFRRFQLPSKEEIERWQQADSTGRVLRQQLIDGGCGQGRSARRGAPGGTPRWSSKCSSWPSISKPARACRHELGTGRQGHVLQPQVEKFDDRAPEFLQDSARPTRVCSRFAARSARHRTTASRCPR